MDPPFTSPASSPQPIGSYFDLVKPISIPNTTSFHHDLDLDGILPDQNADRDDFPEYLKSFHDSGISEARLKRFNWLHPKNYSGAGSLSDDYSLLSPYGTSVSSPRGDEWEIVDNGPRKNIDELWDEVFEYRQRIKLLEEVYQAQAAAAAAEAQCPDLGQIEQGDELRTGTRLSSEMLPDRRWSEYGGGSETCYSPSSMTGSTVSTVTPGLVLFVTTRTTATLDETPMVICSGTIMTQIDTSTRPERVSDPTAAPLQDCCSRLSDRWPVLVNNGAYMIYESAPTCRYFSHTCIFPKLNPRVGHVPLLGWGIALAVYMYIIMAPLKYDSTQAD